MPDNFFTAEAEVFMHTWGSEGRDNGKFLQPWEIAIDSNDNALQLTSSPILMIQGPTLDTTVAYFQTGPSTFQPLASSWQV